jgi:hypothetical protein
MRCVSYCNVTRMAMDRTRTYTCCVGGHSVAYSHVRERTIKQNNKKYKTVKLPVSRCKLKAVQIYAAR